MEMKPKESSKNEKQEMFNPKEAAHRVEELRRSGKLPSVKDVVDAVESTNQEGGKSGIFLKKQK